jgi:predicted transcriptional regulator
MTVNNSIPTNLQKITVMLPEALLSRLREHVPARQRSRFILEAIEERLALEEQITALAETAGAWSDQNHPEMPTDEDIDHWLDNLRQLWSKKES